MMELEKVAAAAFLDELKQIMVGLKAGEREKIASAFHDKLLGHMSAEEITGILKEAGFFDRMKGFVQGGNQNGIPMHSLGSQLAQSNPMQGMGASLASSARQAGGAIGGAASALGGKLSAGAGAVGNFLRGGMQNGIPMHSFGSQMAQSNPSTGMGASLRENLPGAMSALTGGGAARPPMAAAAAAPARAPMRSTPPPLPAAARGAGGGMYGALMSGMAGARSNPLAAMQLGR
jgi:hypothetical protein